MSTGDVIILEEMVVASRDFLEKVDKKLKEMPKKED